MSDPLRAATGPRPLCAGSEIVRRRYRVGSDIDAFVSCFADNAIVADEDRTYQGPAAIRASRCSRPVTRMS